MCALLHLAVRITKRRSKCMLHTFVRHDNDDDGGDENNDDGTVSGGGEVAPPRPPSFSDLCLRNSFLSERRLNGLVPSISWRVQAGPR